MVIHIDGPCLLWPRWSVLNGILPNNSLSRSADSTSRRLFPRGTMNNIALLNKDGEEHSCLWMWAMLRHLVLMPEDHLQHVLFPLTSVECILLGLDFLLSPVRMRPLTGETVWVSIDKDHARGPHLFENAWKWPYLFFAESLTCDPWNTPQNFHFKTLDGQ